MWIDDNVLRLAHRAYTARVWVPRWPMVVVGNSCRAPERHVHLERCAEAGVPVLKRCGGGGTVVLHSGTVVVTIGLWLRRAYQNERYLKLINAMVIDALSDTCGLALGQAGLGDIVAGQRKVGGTSVFRSRGYLLYQLSLLARADLPVIERFLKHPPREPAYRAGRPHRDFLTDLVTLAPDTSPDSVSGALHERLARCCSADLHREMTAPDERQVGFLLRRAYHKAPLLAVGQ